MYFSQEKEIEQSNRRSVESEIQEFLSKETLASWKNLDEDSVIKILRLWVVDHNYQDLLQIWVDPLSLNRYKLVPIWSLEKYKRDNENVYNYDVIPWRNGQP